MLKYSSDSLGYLKWGWLLYLSIVSLLPIVAWRSACPSGQAGLQLPRTAATNVSLDLNNVLKHQSYTITLTNLSRQWWTGNHHVQFLSLSWYYECFPSERVVWQQGRLRTHFVASPVHSSTLLSICPGLLSLFPNWECVTCYCYGILLHTASLQITSTIPFIKDYSSLHTTLICEVFYCI